MMPIEQVLLEIPIHIFSFFLAGAADSGGQEGQPPLLEKYRRGKTIYLPRGKTIYLSLHLADSAGRLSYI